MNKQTLPCFSSGEFQNAHRYLAAQVAIMMGRKFEEGDWANVYCAAKGICLTGWSNLSIDVASGNLGVEHKMICRRSKQSIRESCGTSIMHPAGTRSIRIPNEEDPTMAARDVLGQYRKLLEGRATFVGILDRYHHGASTRDAAITEVAAPRAADLAASDARRAGALRAIDD